MSMKQDMVGLEAPRGKIVGILKLPGVLPVFRSLYAHSNSHSHSYYSNPQACCPPLYSSTVSKSMSRTE